MKKIVKTIFLLIFISFVGCKINALELTKPGSRIYSIKDIRKILNEVLNNTDVEKAILFGSYAKNTPTKNSDID